MLSNKKEEEDWLPAVQSMRSAWLSAIQAHLCKSSNSRRTIIRKNSTARFSPNELMTLKSD